MKIFNPFAAMPDNPLTRAVKEGRRQFNEGKAIERQVKKEQLNARDMQRIGEQLGLDAGEGDTTADAQATFGGTRAQPAQVVGDAVGHVVGRGAGGHQRGRRRSGAGYRPGDLHPCLPGAGAVSG